MRPHRLPGSRSLLVLLTTSLVSAGPLGCGGDDGAPIDPPPDASPPPAATLALLGPVDHLTRASMALRGVRPSLAELDAVAADPAALPGLVDGYLAGPEFAATMRDLHAETFLLRLELPTISLPAIGPLAGKTATELNGALWDEPLRLIEHVITTGRPYTEIVTADYTMANQIVADAWGTPHTGAAAAWQVQRYTDGRPMAGVLTTSALAYRVRSAGANFNRGRANLLSAALLCHDYLDSDIVVDTSIDLSDPDIVANAVVANPSCAGCHQTLDPLGSFYFGMRANAAPVSIEREGYPYRMFDPAKVDDWARATGRPPGFFGAPAATMPELGAAIAADPRFARCAASRFAGYLTQRDRRDVAGAWVARLQAEFVASGFDARALARAVVLSDEFRVSHSTDAAEAEGVVGLLKARPEQLDRMIADLTGFRWTTDSTQGFRGAPMGRSNLLTGDYIGYRVLAGGIDGYYVTTPVFTMTASSSLVLRALAVAAATHVVDHDLAAAAADRRLLVASDPAEPSEAAVRTQLVGMHARILGERLAADDPAIDLDLALFTDVAAASDVRRAWILTVTALLSDLRAVYY